MRLGAQMAQAVAQPRLLSRLGGIRTGVPGWVFQGATYDFDFINNRAWHNGSAKAVAAGLDITRTSSTLAKKLDGSYQVFAANTLPHIPSRGLFPERAATLLNAEFRDLTGVNWTASSTTTALTATGIDGTANAATLLTATGTNGTAKRATITLSSASRTFSACIRRVTGTGTISMTMDNGSTWTDVTALVDASPTIFVQCKVTQTLANPSLGFRLGTSGDAINIDAVNLVAGSVMSAPMVTESRTIETISIKDFSLLIDQPHTVFVEWEEIAGPISTSGYGWRWFKNSNDNHQSMRNSSNKVRSATFVTAAQAQLDSASDVVAGLVYQSAYYFSTNDFEAVYSSNLGASPAADTSGSMPAAASALFYVGSNVGANSLGGFIRRLVIVTGRAIDSPFPDVSMAPQFFIAPAASGDASGNSWSNAAALSSLPNLLERVAPGGRLCLKADAGDYTASTLTIDHGGTAGLPITIAGFNADMTPAKATIVGTRTSPYDVAGNAGSELFKLVRGADHLRFARVIPKNVSTAIRVAAPIADLGIDDADAINVRRFFDTTVSSPETDASVTGLSITNFTGDGYSKSFIRIKYDSSDILIEDGDIDSEGQDGDNFAQGIVFDGTAHDYVVRRVVARNHVDTLNAYWNGDGFSDERTNYNGLYEECEAYGNTDGGFDIKSSGTIMTDCIAGDNKRNFRFWGQITVNGATGLDPLIRGGTGSQAQVHITTGADVVMNDPVLTDDDPMTLVYLQETGGVTTVNNQAVTKATAAILVTEDIPGAFTLVGGSVTNV